MNSVKAPTSVRFRDYLIDSLRDPEEAAEYIEAVLEEEDPEPTLLKSALLDVLEAFDKAAVLPEKTEHHHQKLEKFLTPLGSREIYQLAGWLKELGLKLTVTVDDEPES
jgi:DNA-binding phage protein